MIVRRIALTRTRARVLGVVALAAGIIVLAAPTHAGPGAFTTALSGKSITQVVVDPANSKVIYAAGDDPSSNPYVYKTCDGGDTWASVGPGLGQMTINSMAVSKANDQIVYVGGYNSGKQSIALYQSTNGGGSWSAVATSLGNSSVQAIALDPNGANTSYIGLNNGLAKSTDGATWTLVPGMGSNSIQSLAMDRSSTPVLYAGTNANTNPGVWKSGDGGATWANVSSGLPSGSVNFLAVDVTNNNTLFAGVVASSNGPFLVSKSTNAGGSWATIRITDPLTSVTVDPLNGLNVYYETTAGVYRSTDGGYTWGQIYASGGGTFTVDTQNPQTLYAGTTSGLASFTAALAPSFTPTPVGANLPQGSAQSYTFPQTGHTVSGIWLDFLRSHGDVDNLGYPRSDLVADIANNGQTVQYFQRVVLEYHPEQSPTYQIQRRLLGDLMYPGVDPPADPNARPKGNSVYFPNNPGQGFGHFVADVAPDGSPTYFKQYFDTHGREDTFGYPKEEPHQRTLSDGQSH